MKQFCQGASRQTFPEKRKKGVEAAQVNFHGLVAGAASSLKHGPSLQSKPSEVSSRGHFFCPGVRRRHRLTLGGPAGRRGLEDLVKEKGLEVGLAQVAAQVACAEGRKLAHTHAGRGGRPAGAAVPFAAARRRGLCHGLWARGWALSRDEEAAPLGAAQHPVAAAPPGPAGAAVGLLKEAVELEVAQHETGHFGEPPRQLGSVQTPVSGTGAGGWGGGAHAHTRRGGGGQKGRERGKGG